MAVPVPSAQASEQPAMEAPTPGPSQAPSEEADTDYDPAVSEVKLETDNDCDALNDSEENETVNCDPQTTCR